MPGQALSLFTDFFTHTTGPAYLTGPDVVLNDAQLRNFEGLDAFMRTKRSVQGGASIKDMILLDDPGTAATYQPGEQASISNIQGGNTLTVNWRFIRVYITWTEAEILLNQQGVNSRSAMFHQFKKLKSFKYQQGYTSLLNLIEKLLFAAANNGNMEASAGTEPYSVFASVTDDGLAPSGFTTVQGINPTTKTKWRNQTASYTASTPFDSSNGIIAGFDEISQLVTFKRPPSAKEYFDSEEFRSQWIATNREGRMMYMRAIRANNDITRAGPQDPSYGSPVFNNVPVRAAEALDEQSSFSAASPDYLFLNGNHFKMIFHDQKFMQVSQPMVFPDKPDTTVVWVDTYANLFNSSRARHGYLNAT